MRKGSLVLVLATATASLSGCQLFSPGPGNAVQSAQATPDMTSYFEQRLEDGRRHLAANRLSHAITAYRQASYSTDHTAEAYNGLAIAFDRLGRRDLAAQYFNSAQALAPDDTMIARNLARFDARNAQLDDVEMAVLAAQQDVATGDSTELPVSVAHADFPDTIHGLVRADDGGVALRGRDDWSSRVVSGESERAAVVHVGRTESPSFADSDADTAYPARVQLGDASSSYPVRVEIGGPSASSRATISVRRGPPNGRSSAVRFSSPRG